MLSADALEEFVQARRISTDILTAHPEDPEERLTADHFPVVAFFRTVGAGIEPDAGQAGISISSVLNGGSFESGFAAGSWISIFGENLAPTARNFTPMPPDEMKEFSHRTAARYKMALDRKFSAHIDA